MISQVEAMVDFLFSDDLAARVHDVVSGDDVRCAVAFWGKGANASLFGRGAVPRGVHIVCDVSMGGTSVEALEELGAPRSKKLRHVVGLHAKVYISSTGMVVSSANASAAGLYFGDHSRRHIEAGTFHPSGSKAWADACTWFNDLYKGAHKVDKPALEWAKKVFRPPVEGGPLGAPRPGSLLDAVRAAPDKFAGIGFVFVSKPNSAQELASAVAAARAKGGAIDDWDTKHVFTGWDKSDVDIWPTSFIEFWIPREKLTIVGHLAQLHLPDEGAILAASGWRQIAKIINEPLPTKAAIEKTDAALAKLILGERGGILFANARALAQRLAEVAR